tara:strand:- start:1257 stop:2135 length:879 start_codon:yes stop_codon:yes gene_type:complete
MRKKKKINILVTGAGTLIGNSICVYLLSKKYNVLGSYKTNKPKNLKNKILKIDLDKKIKLNFKFDYLVHCASAIPDYNLNSKSMFKTNLYGLKNLLKSVDQKRCEKIILISSSSVFGKPKDKIVKKNVKLKPIDAYGKSKLQMENELIKFCKINKINYSIFRLTGVIGKNSSHNFLSNCFNKIKNNKKLYISNPNLKFNTLVNVNNLVKIIMKSINIKYDEIHNLGTRYPMKLINIIKFFYLKLKKKENFKVIKSLDKGYSINLSKDLKKRYRIFTTKESLRKFILDNNIKQ